MDLSAAQHQLHHRYLNHHHHQVHHQQQQQEMDSESLDSIIACSKQGAAAAAASAAAGQEKSPKPKPADNEAQKCPRCDSTNTKFCYYNNYSLSQPRYFCKACRRYWTKGGTLRNVPVGGGCRKSNKRPSSPSSLLIKRPHSHDVITTSSFAAAPHSAPPSSNNPALFYGGSSSRGGFDHHHALQLQLQGNATLTDCDGLLPNPHAFTFLDSLRHNGGLFQSLGYGAGDAGSVVADDVAGGGGGSHAATAVANVKQENDGRALWGFPWQVNYGEMGAADVEPIRGSWNGLIGNSAWQGLLNSPAALM